MQQQPSDKDPFAECPNQEFKAASLKVNKKSKKKKEKFAKDLAKEKAEIEASSGNISNLPPVRVRHDRDSSNGNLDVSLKNISVTAGGKVLLLNADVQITYGQKYGLVGRNGIGKTTWLTALARGDFEGIPKHIQILTVEQEISGIAKTPLDYVLETDQERLDLIKEEERLLDVQGKEEGAAEALQEVYDRLDMIDAHNAEEKAIAILSGLGFNTEMQNRPTKSLSGGWRMRVALARALFVKPDILLLDEPTNHLDLDAVMWLEDYIIDCEMSIVVVSHDRSFLNSVCDNIIHFHNQKLNYYTGNYDQYEQTRAELEQNQSKLHTKQQKEASHMQDFINKYRATKQLSSLVQSRIKALEKMQCIEAVVNDPAIVFKFPDAGKCPIPYLQLENANFGYSADQPILKDVNFTVDDKSRIALVGPNGAGKSTLLKMLLGDNEIQSGEHRRNPHCRISLFNQHHMDQLDLAVSALGQLMQMFPNEKQEAYRGHLSRFGITAQMQVQQQKFLSGGQKSRVALAIAAWNKPHLFILDEPTNHLDIDAVNALTVALNTWEGGILVVSHDQHFISNVCDSIWIVRDQGLKQFYGDFDDYKQMLREEIAEKNAK